MYPDCRQRVVLEAFTGSRVLRKARAPYLEIGYEGFAIIEKQLFLPYKLKIFIMLGLFKTKKTKQKPFLTEEQIKLLVAKKLENPKAVYLAKRGFYLLMIVMITLFFIRQFLW